MSTRFLTIADVAEQLQLSAQAVRALIRTGDLPAIQVGARKLWRIEDQALEDYIQRQLASTRAMVAAGWSEDEALEDYIQRQLASTRAMVAAGWNEDGAP